MLIVPPSPQVLALLGELIEERIGLHYKLADFDLLSDKVSRRAAAAGFDSLLDYYYALRYDDRSEFEELVDELVVGETYFFREPGPLRVLVEERLAPAARAGTRPRVWCAACATGEEPLTLAMMLDEQGLLGEVEIVASDISRRSLARAKAGRYGGRALRAIPAGAIGRWLEREGEAVRVRQELKDAVRWEHVNLLDAEAVRRLGTFDVVLCRNVLIYFRDETVRRVASTLAGALSPGGWLLVGVSESLLRFGTLLTCEERRGVFVYRTGS